MYFKYYYSYKISSIDQKHIPDPNNNILADIVPNTIIAF